VVVPRWYRCLLAYGQSVSGQTSSFADKAPNQDLMASVVEWKIRYGTGLIEEQYYYRTSARRLDNEKAAFGHQWQMKVIKIIWTKRRELWKLRNQDVYGKDATTIAQAESRMRNVTWKYCTPSAHK
jgi:hypothetical protein